MAMTAEEATVFAIGWPFDLLVRHKGKWIAVEVKNPDDKRGLTRIQQVVADIDDDSLVVVRTVEEALGVVGHGR